MSDEHTNLTLHGRGHAELSIFVRTCQHELADNDHKGHWLEREDRPGELRTDLDLMGDLLYHCAKLGAAVAAGNRTAILEYAADVGNCAMFVADKHEALDLIYLHDGAVEYDDEVEPVATPAEYSELRRAAYDWAAVALTPSTLEPKPSTEAPTQRDRSPTAAEATGGAGEPMFVPPKLDEDMREGRAPKPGERYYPQDTEATMQQLSERRRPPRDFDF